MGIDWSDDLYAPCQDVFSRPVTVTPLASQPGAPAYPARGIFNTNIINVLLEDGSLYGEQQTILDILIADYAVLPLQGDQINIPVDPVSGMAARGVFMVTNRGDNAGGEMTLELKRVDS
jgi:hypothetical protein